ncbi:rhodanese-like domain-containing protein [Helicobacter felis]|uniref:Rhodanese-like domain protein n=1 Tax=Helicobacter felis (strain ATCC 49179 / CCUG 28539 / NCTC 12436 / CS1) TaxID=936155 RepID=E7A8W7_HELFC|nr:rhodanese-like domain-containing protein [Helicobacter felis]CBY83248.1 rhodanese-like domain protein [Helicobacter felis ATCC 49179]
MFKSDYTHHLVDVKDVNLKDYCIIDIRDANAYRQSHLKEARHMEDIEAIKDFALAHPKEKILLQCRHGNMASHYASALHSAGADNVYFLKGNFEEFKDLGLELVEN